MNPMQAGDVDATYAYAARLRQHAGCAPDTPLAIGLQRFADWHRSYYDVA